MSWSISKTIGEADKVRAAVAPEFDSAAKNYTGTPEEQDVLAAKASVLAWLDTVPEGHAAQVEACGFRGSGWLTIKVDCQAVKLVK